MIAMMVIGSPELVFRFLGAQMNTTVGQYFTLSLLINALLALLTVYVIPIVFLKRTNFSAVLGRILFLTQNARSSLLIVGIVSIALLLHSAGIVILQQWPTPWSAASVIILGVLVAFLYLMSFAAATRVLMGSARSNEFYHPVS